MNPLFFRISLPVLLLATLFSSTSFGACTTAATTRSCTSSTAVNLNYTGAGPVIAGSPNPTDNVVDGVAVGSTISKVTIRLNGLSSSDPDDFDMVLVSPDNRAFVFWSDVGGFRFTTICNSPFPCSTNNYTITVDDAGATRLPDGNAAGCPIGSCSGDTRILVNNTTYQPMNSGSGIDSFPGLPFALTAANFAQNPSILTPTLTYLNGTGTFANIFNGSSNINGTWRLYIANAGVTGDTGSLTSWTLNITTVANAAPTTTTITSNNNPSLIGTSPSVTFTANVISTSAPIGTVTFTEGATVLSGPTSVVPVNGTTSSIAFTTSALSEGTHTIAATFTPGVGFGPSSGSVSQTVNRATTITGNTYCNTGTITIPSTFNPNPASTPYPSNLFVTGLGGSISKVTMDLKGYSHSFPDDVEVLLVSPTGAKFIPMASVGGITGAVSNLNLTLDDFAASILPDGAGLASGTFRPRAYTGGGATVAFPAPAPAGPYSNAAPFGTSTFANTFSGLPNGTWQLFVITHGGVDPAPTQFGGGWCLNFTTTNDPATTTSPSVNPTPSVLNSSVLVSALVVNATNSNPVNALGTVTFQEGNIVLAGPLSLGSNGVASFNTSTLIQGAHTLTANYSGSAGNFNLSNGSVLHYVDAATTNPAQGQFCNASSVAFPNVIGASGAPYPTRVNVSGMAGSVQKATLSLNGFSHQFPDDVDMMLTGPNGNSLIALSDVGGGTAVTNLNMVLDSTAASPLPDATTLSSGTFRPTDFEIGTDAFASPAPTTNVFSASTTTLGTAFNNINPNGLWTLWTTNDSSGAQGGGSLSGGWCVNLTMNPPVLSITKTHAGNFTQGQTGAQYTVTVTNGGPGSTAGTVTVVDNPPAAMTVTAMSGSGWTCTVGTRTCTTAATAAAGISLPAITVTVTVAANATSPLTNSATASGGGSTGSVTANDSTNIAQVADLTLTKTSSSGFVQGGTGSFTITVNNIGAGSTSGSYTISDTMPVGLTIVGTPSGTGWDCSLSTATSVSCIRPTVIAAASSAPAVTVNVNIAANAAASITNTATATGGGELITSNNSGSVTVSVTPQTGVTIIVPAGITYTLNSVLLTGTQTVQLAPGTYTLSTTTPQSTGVGQRAVFASWSDAGAISHSITVATAPLTITGAFTTQFQLTTAASPLIGGTVTPATGTFFDSGTVVNLTATPNSGFVFANWTGAVANASAAATTVTISAPQTVTANFTAQTGVTIIVPAGITYTLNSVLLTGTQTVQLAPGTYTLSTTTPQSTGVGQRAVFASWSDAGAISHSITVATAPLTITGAFTTQFQLTTAASPLLGGTVTPATGTFFDSGTVVNLTATPNSGFVFANWTGAVANASAAATTVTVSAPQTVTANFTAQTGVTIIVPAGITYTLNSVLLTGTQTVQLAPGTYTLSTTTPQSTGVGQRAVFASWSDAGAISHSITVAAAPLTITGAFTTQFQLTTAASPLLGGTVTPATGTFFDSGTVVNLTATPNSGFVFANWTGAVANASAAATTVTMSAPQTVTANFSVATSPAWTITKTHTGNFSQGKNGATYTVTATNTGTGSTNGTTVTVSDTIPAGLTLVTMVGTGWTCVANSCTRNDVLGSGLSYPAITVTVNVDAAAAGSVTNSAAVSGGGATTQSVNDPTTINPIVDVTGQVSMVTSGLGRNRATGLWSETLTITNTTASTISGPVQVVLSALSSNATMTNNTGMRNGFPFITVLPGGGTILPGASVSVTLTFQNPTNGFINFTPLAFFGTF